MNKCKTLPLVGTQFQYTCRVANLHIVLFQWVYVVAQRSTMNCPRLIMEIDLTWPYAKLEFNELYNQKKFLNNNILKDFIYRNILEMFHLASYCMYNLNNITFSVIFNFCELIKFCYPILPLVICICIQTACSRILKI